PRIVQTVKDGVKVQFLDVNTFIFECGLEKTEAEYIACTNKLNYNIYYAATPSFAQANLYVYRYYIALKNLDQSAHWRMTRGHHAIFTIDDADFRTFLHK